MFPFLKKSDKPPDISTGIVSSSTVGALGPGVLDLAEASLATFESLWQQLKRLLLLHSSSSSQTGGGERQLPQQYQPPQRSQQDCDAPLQYIDKLYLLLAHERSLDATEHTSSTNAPCLPASCTNSPIAATQSPIGSSVGPLLAYALAEGVFEEIVDWCLGGEGGDPTTAARGSSGCLVALLRSFEQLVGHAQQERLPLLQQPTFVGPLLALLSAASSQLSEDRAVDDSLVAILHSLCIAARADAGVLGVLFSAATDSRAAASLRQKPSFLVFSLLVPYVHREGLVGQKARDALLLVMAASASNDNVGCYIAEKSDFCPVLAAGLSALYSTLPRKLKVTGDAWHQIEEGDYADIPEAMAIVNALSFCNAVIQLAHPAISAQLVAFIYEGFLIPVLGPALHQNSSGEIIAATAYLSLLLRHVSEPALMRAFLRFIFLGHHDDSAVIDTLISRIGGHSKMCIVSLSLFSFLLDLGCEDVMHQLVFRYLLPCNHIMASQKRYIKETDLYSKSAEKFLGMIPDCCCSSVGVLPEQLQLSDRVSYSYANQRLFEQPPTSSGADEASHRLSDYASDYNDYLADARRRVLSCMRRSRQWRFHYAVPQSVDRLACAVDPTAAYCRSQACVLSHKYDISPMAGALDAPESRGWAASAFSDTSVETSECSCGVTDPERLAQLPSSRPFSESAPPRIEMHGTAGTFVSYIDSTYLDEERTRLLASDSPASAASPALEGQTAISSGSIPMSAVSSRRQPSGSVDTLREDQRKRDPGRHLIGSFLSALFGKLEQMMHNSLYVNLMLTGVISQLASYPQPLLRSFLLNSHLICQPEVKTLALTLSRVKQRVDDFARSRSDFGQLLVQARSSLCWKEELALLSGRSSGSSSNYPLPRDVPHKAPTPTASHSGEKRRLRLPGLLLNFGKNRGGSPQPQPQAANVLLGSGKVTAGQNGVPAELETPAARLEALTLKNAVYCAIVLEEFVKELAALSQEHAVIAATAADEGYHSPGLG